LNLQEIARVTVAGPTVFVVRSTKKEALSATARDLETDKQIEYLTNAFGLSRFVSVHFGSAEALLEISVRHTHLLILAAFCPVPLDAW
jgi:hypothetical protein